MEQRALEEPKARVGNWVVPTKVNECGAKEEKGIQGPLMGETKQGLGIGCLQTKASKEFRLKSTKHVPR